MRITPLGHTEFLIDISNRSGENVRILVDSWLSDFVVGDLMERTVKVGLDPEKLQTLDAIYVSHSHTDHLDPYTLVEIYKCSNPVLFLSETLRYLDPLFRQYLPSADIRYLKNKSTISWNGLDITAIALEGEDITNEDDVMMFSVASDTELLFAEIDTIPPDTKDAQMSLYKHFTRKKYDTVCYLASRNELDGNIKVLDVSPEQRETFKKGYLNERKEMIEWQYSKWEYEEYEDIPNIFEIPGFVRGFIGQGLCYPGYLSIHLAGVNIFPLDEVVDREVALAKNYGFDFPQRALLPGKTYKINNNITITVQKYDGIGELHTQYPRTSLPVSGIRHYADGPLFLRNEHTAEDRVCIIDILNHRFLPYWSASSLGNIREAIYKNQSRAYRIQFQTHKSEGETEHIVFEYSFAHMKFEQIEYEKGMPIDETYWIDDVLDYLDGRQDLYSSFWHRLDPTKVYRLWTCLGANWLNNDLVYAKYALHFARANQGETVKEWIHTMLQGIRNE